MKEFRSHRVEHMVDFSQRDMSRVAGDILLPAGGWSWTQKRPTVKLRVRGTNQVRYVIDFAIADATLIDTGPVAIAFFVNGHTLDVLRFATPGPQHYEKVVPAEWLDAAQDNLTGAEIDKVWVSPNDGAKLGFILNRLGLTEP
jgi:hypothetical protein